MASLKSAGDLTGSRLAARTVTVDLQRLADGSFLDTELATLAGRTVAIVTSSQLAAALAMVELDGIAGAMMLCPPDLAHAHLVAAVAEAGADVIVTDDPGRDWHGMNAQVVTVGATARTTPAAVVSRVATRWILFTSGTSGPPKMVVHDLVRLAGAIGASKPVQGPVVVWSTFYDIRRYGGLQIFLRAVLGGSALVLSDADEPVPEFLARVVSGGVTHISGTPSHWRRVLMRPPVAGFAPGYIRLSGEIADQPILDGLAAAFPHARIVHAFASTEAGVGFEVGDGRAGFPGSLLGLDGYAAGDGRVGGVAMKVHDGTLHIRSPRTASSYVGGAALGEADGFVDTGDMVEQHGDRYYFVGRRGGIINVGGLKVNPEEVEAVINRHPMVEMSLVKGRRNPVTGALVAAEVVLKGGDANRHSIEAGIRALCREALAAHKVPATFKFVSTLAMTAGGKLARQTP